MEKGLHLSTGDRIFIVAVVYAPWAAAALGLYLFIYG
jgi:hypothetical protein